jgi:hypothetical protein
MFSMPAVPNVVVRVAVRVGGAPVIGLKGRVAMVGVPAIALPLAVKATVPVGPAPPLAVAVTVAVKVTGVAVVTPVDGLAARAPCVVALDTIMVSVTGVVTAL